MGGKYNYTFYFFYKGSVIALVDLD